MGWAHCGTDGLGREVGYGVPAECDHPGCGAAIDRGLAYCCGGMHFDTGNGCARYFCGEHLYAHDCDPGDGLVKVERCEACNKPLTAGDLETNGGLCQRCVTDTP